MASAAVAAEPEAPLAVLHRVFGFPALRGLQQAAVERVVAGGDALVLMPTGGGKSVCYQVPALCRPGTALVISPADRADGRPGRRAAATRRRRRRRSIPSWSRRRSARRRRALEAGRLDLLYVSPERLLGGGMLERLARRQLALIAIDEAHCVSQWGHEFRPEYRDARLPAGPLSRRAAHRADRDRRCAHAHRHPRTRSACRVREVFVASFHRPNLHVAAAAEGGRDARSCWRCSRRHHGDAGIVYCGSRAKTERVAAVLAGPRLSRASPSMPGCRRKPSAPRRARFRSGEAVVVVATIAFGMGIDRPDVRFVVHLDMPDSPEAFYQQIGRAGRDGEPAETLLLYGGEDIARARYLLGQSAAPEEQKRGDAHAAGGDDRADRDRVLPHPRAARPASARSFAAPCGHCDNCAAPRSARSTAPWRRRRCSPRSGAPASVSARSTWWTCCSARRPRRCAHWSHDQLPTFGIGTERARALLARRDPAVDRARRDRCGSGRRVPHTAACRRRRAADPARRDARDAARRAARAPERPRAAALGGRCGCAPKAAPSRRCARGAPRRPSSRRCRPT